MLAPTVEARPEARTTYTKSRKRPGDYRPRSELRGNNRVEFRIKANSEVT
jgi:hypothetical protein